jgi:hypothetical protein
MPIFDDIGRTTGIPGAIDAGDQGEIIVSQPSYAVPVADSFSAGTYFLHGTEPLDVSNGSTWVASSTLRIFNNELDFLNLNEAARILFGSVDQFVRMKYNAGGFDNRLAVLARAIYSGSTIVSAYGIDFRQGDGEIRISRYTNDVATSLGSYMVSLGSSTDYKLGIRVQGSTITGYLDDEKVIQVTDTVYTLGVHAGFKLIGINSGTSSGDDFQLDHAQEIRSSIASIDVASFDAVLASQEVNASVGVIAVASINATVTASDSLSSSVGVVSVSKVNASIEIVIYDTNIVATIGRANVVSFDAVVINEYVDLWVSPESTSDEWVSVDIVNF